MEPGATCAARAWLRHSFHIARGLSGASWPAFWCPGRRSWLPLCVSFCKRFAHSCFFPLSFLLGTVWLISQLSPSGEGRLWHSRCHRPSRLLAMEWLRILQSLVSTSSVLSLPPEVLEVSQKPPELSWARAGRGAGHSGSLAAVPQSH